MNAYELADAIEDWDSDGQWDTPAANMLRQQADRIAELEKQGEPVAWIRSGDDQLSLVKEKDDGYMVWKPLYLAPQTKPLSDEAEIVALLDGIDKEESECDNGWWETSYGAKFGADVLEKIKTILRKPHKYDPETGEPLIDGYPLFSGLPRQQTKPLSDEEIYKLWCEADNTELLPEMRLKDGSINYIITTFAKLIEERHGIK